VGETALLRFDLIPLALTFMLVYPVVMGCCPSVLHVFFMIVIITTHATHKDIGRTL
jgi:hypothetical protein